MNVLHKSVSCILQSGLDCPGCTVWQPGKVETHCVIKAAQTPGSQRSIQRHFRAVHACVLTRSPTLSRACSSFSSPPRPVFIFLCTLATSLFLDKSPPSADLSVQPFCHPSSLRNPQDDVCGPPWLCLCLSMVSRLSPLGTLRHTGLFCQ
jgi:hypothetical protein